MYKTGQSKLRHEYNCNLYCNSNCNSDSRFCLCPVVKVLKSPENVSLRLKDPCEVVL